MPFDFLTAPLMILAAALAFVPPAPAQLAIPKPALISPASDAVMDNGCRDQSDAIIWDFDWDEVPGATEYHIRVWFNPAKPIVNTSVSASQYRSVSRQSHIIERNRKGWCWNVRAGIAGNWGEGSETRCFEVEPPDTDCY